MFVVCFVIDIQFQSTHPRRVRPIECSICFSSSDFNPRTREGCDYNIDVKMNVIFYFNPRTREGCDKANSLPPSEKIISIHAPAKGATDNFKIDSSVSTFQSTHPRRVRLGFRNVLEGVQIQFQSTHPRRVRRVYLQLLV